MLKTFLMLVIGLFLLITDPVLTLSELEMGLVFVYFCFFPELGGGQPFLLDLGLWWLVIAATGLLSPGTLAGELFGELHLEDILLFVVTGDSFTGLPVITFFGFVGEFSLLATALPLQSEGMVSPDISGEQQSVPQHLMVPSLFFHTCTL